MGHSFDALGYGTIDKAIFPTIDAPERITNDESPLRLTMRGRRLGCSTSGAAPPAGRNQDGRDSPSAECRMQNAKCKMQNAKCKSKSKKQKAKKPRTGALWKPGLEDGRRCSGAPAQPQVRSTTKKRKPRRAQLAPISGPSGLEDCVAPAYLGLRPGYAGLRPRLPQRGPVGLRTSNTRKAGGERSENTPCSQTAQTPAASSPRPIPPSRCTDD